MEKTEKTALIVGGILITGYIIYKIVTRPNNYKYATYTNTKATIPSPSASPATNVTYNNVNKSAYTSQPNVQLLRDPGKKELFGIVEFINNVDQTIPLEGTYVGDVLGVFPDLNDNGDQWYKLNSTSTAFLHKGDSLFVNTNEVTIK
ncbi:MAG: hypothetical protein ACRDE2_00040 [Chitinophagaceae bacterium]